MGSDDSRTTLEKVSRNPIASGTHGLELRTLDDYYRWAQYVSKSGVVPKSLRTPEQVMVALQTGAELGMKPMQSLGCIMVVNGRACLWGDGMLAVAQASGHLEDIRETVRGDGDNMVAKCEVKRRGRPTPIVAEFSWADAKRAGLAGKDTYRQYPARMLRARARAFALRDALPDVLTGIVSADEAEDLAPSQPAVFAPGDEQPADDLDALVATAAVETADDGAPSKQDLEDAGLLFETNENVGQ